MPCYLIIMLLISSLKTLVKNDTCDSILPFLISSGSLREFLNQRWQMPWCCMLLVGLISVYQAEQSLQLHLINKVNVDQMEICKAKFGV